MAAAGLVAEGVALKSGKLKERTIKFIIKNPHGPGTDEYLYAEAGEEVCWDGGRCEDPANYGGRDILWCTLWSGESIGLEEGEVEWDEDTD